MTQPTHRPAGELKVHDQVRIDAGEGPDVFNVVGTSRCQYDHEHYVCDKVELQLQLSPSSPNFSAGHIWHWYASDAPIELIRPAEQACREEYCDRSGAGDLTEDGYCFLHRNRETRGR